MSWLFGPQELFRSLFFPAIFLGIPFVCVYGFKCWRGSLEYSIDALAAIFLQCGGLVSGLLLMLLPISSAIDGSYTPLPFQTFIGGVLLSAVSIRGLYKNLSGTVSSSPKLRELQEEILQAARHRDPSKESWLLELAESHESGAVRRDAIVALQRLRSTKVWPLLLSILASEHDDENLRETAVETLGEVGSEETLAILRRLVVSGDSARYQLAAQRALARLESRLQAAPTGTAAQGEDSGYRDVFLCHASEDRQTIVEPLVAALEAERVSCWYSQAEITWGDSVTEKVNLGLRASRYILAILTSAFLGKNWPRRELNAFLNIEARTGAIRVLVLLAGSREENERILGELPLLDDKLYLVWQGKAEPIAAELKKRISLSVTPSDPAQSPFPPGRRSPASGALEVVGEIGSRRELFAKRLVCNDARKYLHDIAHTIQNMAAKVAGGEVPHAELEAVRTHARVLADALGSSLTLMEADKLVAELERISEEATFPAKDSAAQEAFVGDLQRVSGLFYALGSACAVNYA